VAERAEAVAAFINGAASHPVKKRDVVAAVGGGHMTDRAISALVESGRLTSRSGGEASGYYPSGSH
jgi:hypothetical protein